MALPRYRINTPTPGAVIRGIVYPPGAEVDLQPTDKPRSSWEPLNEEARACFKKAGLSSLTAAEYHRKIHGIREEE